MISNEATSALKSIVEVFTSCDSTVSTAAVGLVPDTAVDTAGELSTEVPCFL